jgi:helix-turn-helix protein
VNRGSATGILTARLEHAARRLCERLAMLEARLTDDAAWDEYRETAAALAAILPTLAPERRGWLLTTAELAERLGVSPKTVLRRKASGELKPAVVMGRRGRAALRWRGDEGASVT